MTNTIMTLTSDATFKDHTFKILQTATYKHSGEEFYLVEDMKARKNKYQVINLTHAGHFHSYGVVKTEDRANEFFKRRCEMYA